MALSLVLVLLLTSYMKLPTVLSFSPTPTASTYHQYYYFRHQQQRQQRHYHQHTQSSPILSLQMMDMSDIISTTNSVTIYTITNTITNTATTSSNILNAVETFDGSLVKSTVVLNAYWTNIQSNIGRVIIGQAIAIVIFAILTFFISTQDISDFVAKNVFKEDVAQSAEANVSQFKKSVMTKVNSPTETPNLGKLLLCLTIETIGTRSQLVPIIGELTDFVWAPIAALTLRSIFQGRNVVFALEFVEELLPFTDVLPLATICWIVEIFLVILVLQSLCRLVIMVKMSMGANGVYCKG
jgi:hypothetical protein